MLKWITNGEHFTSGHRKEQVQKKPEIEKENWLCAQEFSI